MSESRFEIWKDGHLHSELSDKDEANRIFDNMRKFKPQPRVLQLYEKITVTKLRRDNDEVYDD